MKIKFLIYFIVLFTVPIFANQENFYRVDSIAVIGNNHTKDFVILRELTFKPGDYINDSILIFNRERVFSLGIFTKVKLIPITIDSLNVIHIIVDEAWYYWIEPFAYKKNKTSDKYSYGSKLKLNNFRGYNEYLNVLAYLGYDSGLQLIYYTPYFLSNRKYGLYLKFNDLVTTNLSNEYKKLNNNENFKYNAFSIGSYISYRTDIYHSFLFGAFYYDNHVLSKLNTNQIKKQYNIYNQYIAYAYDTRDLVQIPQSGVYTRFSFENNITSQGDDYFVVKSDFRKYGPIIENLSYKIRTSAAILRGKNIPFFDRLFIGTYERIRGYTNSILEGYNLLMLQGEIRYPLHDVTYLDLNFTILPKSLGRYRFQTFLQFFIDYGKTTFHMKDMLQTPAQYGFGASLNFIFLPYKAIRFEYAMNKYNKGEFIIEGDFSF